MQYLNVARVLIAEAHQQEAAAARARALRPRATSKPSSGPPLVVTYSGDLSPVVDCIKHAESGNYNEASHPGSGSGAYQFVPGTWRAWFGRWRDQLPPDQQAMVPYYSYAYQAPPSVQDAVLTYTLTHGGAGNWSNRYGADNCTAGLPGGG